MTPALVCRSLSVCHGEVEAVRSLDLVLEQGETLALLGPSGSGKSTLLYAIAGFLDVANGEIEIAGRVRSAPGRTEPPERRPIGMVFQNYALWPHVTAEDTVAYPLRRAGHERPEATRRAREFLDLVDIPHLGHRKPAQLSGGEQQRVGLARALARDAELYLFDEPTAHLDSALRTALQAEIRRHRTRGAATVYATHDAAEALGLAERVAIIRDGKIVQMGSSQEVYERPVDVWAARLTGPASLLGVESIHPAVGGVELVVGSSSIVVEIPWRGPSEDVMVLIRPEWVSLGGPTAGTVRQVLYRGSHTDYRIETASGELEARLPGPPLVREGERASWSIDRGWLPPGQDGRGP